MKIIRALVSGEASSGHPGGTAGCPVPIEHRDSPQRIHRQLSARTSLCAGPSPGIIRCVPDTNCRVRCANREGAGRSDHRQADACSTLPKARHHAKPPNAVRFDVRSALYQLTGVDLTQIHGIGPFLALRLIAECGTDLSQCRSAKHFTSWLTLSPGCKISGGKVLSARSRKSTNRLTAHLRLAAVAVGKTNTALRAFYRRLAARIGKAKAVTAAARKIAILFCNAMRFGMSYLV